MDKPPMGLKPKEEKDRLPIWVSDWTFEDKRGAVYIIKDVIVKGDNEDDIINNPFLITRVLKRIKNKRKKHTLKAVNVKLKTQHGYGPKYEDEQFFK